MTFRIGGCPNTERVLVLARPPFMKGADFFERIREAETQDKNQIRHRFCGVAVRLFHCLVCVYGGAAPETGLHTSKSCSGSAGVYQQAYPFYGVAMTLALTGFPQFLSKFLAESPNDLEKQKKGLLQQIFNQEIRFKDENGNNYPDWEKKKLGDILKDFYLGGNYKNSTKITKYPLLKMGNLDRGKINLNKIEYIEENEPINERDKIHFGDLFFNTRNTPDLVGKVAIWRNELPLMYFNSNLMKMTFDNNFFMNYKFNTKKVILKLRSIATGTTSVGAIYTKDLLKLELNIPCLEEQTKIADFLSAFDRKIDNQKAQLEHWKQIKKGLLQQMFV